MKIDSKICSSCKGLVQQLSQVLTARPRGMISDLFRPCCHHHHHPHPPRFYFPMKSILASLTLVSTASSAATVSWTGSATASRGDSCTAASKLPVQYTVVAVTATTAAPFETCSEVLKSPKNQYWKSIFDCAKTEYTVYECTSSDCSTGCTIHTDKSFISRYVDIKQWDAGSTTKNPCYLSGKGSDIDADYYHQVNTTSGDFQKGMKICEAGTSSNAPSPGVSSGSQLHAASYVSTLFLAVAARTFFW